MAGGSEVRMVRVRIAGRVQGVGYRAWAEDQARGLGLGGWVRNRRDGSVEAVFAGTPETVADMIQACRRGPRLSRVDALDEHDANLNDLGQRHAGETFSLLPTV
jgi:acylphosphatase